MSAPKTDTCRVLRPWMVAVLTLGLIWSAAMWYSITECGSVPVGASGPPPQLFRQAEGLAPFMDVVPSQDGSELYVRAGGVGELGGAVYVNLGIGPGHHKGGWTMTYSDVVRSYVTTIPGFTPQIDDYGSLRITTTLGLDSGNADFSRRFVPRATTASLRSQDGTLQMDILSTDTIDQDTYVAIVPSFGPPRPAPLGYHLVGRTYSVRAAGALLETDRPMNVRLGYDAGALAGASPHSLSLMAWDAYRKQWDELGGRLFSQQQYLSLPTERFTAYALMVAPSWRDEFDGFDGLDSPGQTSNVTLGGTPENRTLILLPTATQGYAVSRPIYPATGLGAWERLEFGATTEPSTTTLRVDLLAGDGSVVLENVAGGTDLSGVDVRQYPTLRLRAVLSSTVAGETPALDRWRLSWRAESSTIYLPFVER